MLPYLARMVCRYQLLSICIAGLVGCAETGTPRPSAGMAILDAASPHVGQDRIVHSSIISVNGMAVGRRQCELSPGRNTVRVGFQWPQGGEGQVNLRFHATAGTTYCVSYDPYPPYAERGSRGEKLPDLVSGMGDMGMATIAISPLIGAMTVPLVGEGMAGDARERQRPADRMDIRVIAYRSPQGIVREVRVWPDGRVDEATRAPYAQMSPPS